MDVELLASYSHCNYPNSRTCNLFSSCVGCVLSVCVILGSMSMPEQSKDMCFRRDMEMASFWRRDRIYGYKRYLMAWNAESTFSGHVKGTSLNLPKDSFLLGSHLFIHTSFDHPTRFIFRSFIFRPFHIGLARNC